MEFHKHILGYPLSNYIQHIVYVRDSSPILSDTYIKELPDKGVNLVIELEEKTVNSAFMGNDFEERRMMKNAWISGTQAQAIFYQNQQNSAILSIRFTTGGFYALTKIPIAEVPVCAEAELILGSSFRKLYEKLVNESLPSKLFSHIENYFLGYTSNDVFEDSVVKFIDTHIEKPIDWLINKSGYSQKHVIHLVKQHTGFSPKHLQRLHRFQEVVKELQAMKGTPNWFAIVNDHGYYDQAHFIKEFSNFSGVKPTAYLRSQVDMEQNQLVSDMILRPKLDLP
jgi:AraC-like DNA-binding protein